MSPEPDITPVYGNGSGTTHALSPLKKVVESLVPAAFNSAEIVPVPVIGEGETWISTKSVPELSAVIETELGLPPAEYEPVLYILPLPSTVKTFVPVFACVAPFRVTIPSKTISVESVPSKASIMLRIWADVIACPVTMPVFGIVAMFINIINLN